VHPVGPGVRPELALQVVDSLADNPTGLAEVHAGEVVVALHDAAVDHDRVRVTTLSLKRDMAIGVQYREHDRGWSLTDQQLALGIRSVAAPLRDGSGRVIAAMNVTVHAAETPVEMLTKQYPPLLLQTAGAISADWAACQASPQVTVPVGRAAS
jgi:hypothetical protein